MKIIHDIPVPAKHGRACRVEKGQIIRFHLPEGEQVGDAAFFNAANPKEQFHVGQTWSLNVILGTGTSKNYKHFYSNPPFENVMMTVIEDTVGSHFGNCAGRCTSRLLSMRDNLEASRSCQENLAEALVSFGINGEDIHDVFNVFMRVELDTEGGFSVQAPQTKPGDFIDLRAEMDLIVALSACPNETNVVNNFVAKPMGILVYEQT